MEIITAKVGDEIRSRHSAPSDPPLAVVAKAWNGEVQIVLGEPSDLQIELHRLAASLIAQNENQRKYSSRLERRKRNRYA